MLQRWDSKDIIPILGIMSCLLCVVVEGLQLNIKSNKPGDESFDEKKNEEAIMNLLYRTKITEEEKQSPHIPDAYLCDACLAVAFAVEQVFIESERRNTKTKLSEAYLVDLIDNLCENAYFWEAYGIKEVDGQKKFSGPGLEAEDEFGFNREGQLWVIRMMDLCSGATGEFEARELYKMFKKGKLPELKENLCSTKYCKKPRKKSDEL